MLLYNYWNSTTMLVSNHVGTRIHRSVECLLLEIPGRRRRRTVFTCKMYVCTMPYLSPFVPLYPTYRSCFKEFRPPIFLRNRYPWYRPKTQEQISSTEPNIKYLQSSQRRDSKPPFFNRTIELPKTPACSYFGGLFSKMPNERHPPSGLPPLPPSSIEHTVHTRNFPRPSMARLTSKVKTTNKISTIWTKLLKNFVPI